MTKKFYSIAMPFAFAMAFGLSACSDDSSSGAGANVNTGDEISFDIPTGNGSSSSKIDTLRVEVYDSEESGSSADAESSSSASGKSSSSASDNAFINEGWREDCLAKINAYRATEDLPPLALASEEKLTCIDKQSADDLKSNKAHGHMGDCGESAQNSGPNFSTTWQANATAVAESYLKMMWEDEKAKAEKGETEYSKIGHYLNMKNTSYTKVACGIALSSDGKTGWFNVDFF